MATFTGTDADETITPSLLSPSVTSSSGLPPGVEDDLIIAGGGADIVGGGTGSDTAHLGGGADLFIWNPGDGSDTIYGDAGYDTLQVNGSNVSENVYLTANGSHLSFFRNVGSVTLDVISVERVRYNAFGGTDLISVIDLTGTGVRLADINLEATVGSGAGDGQIDTVNVIGSAGADTISIAKMSQGVSVDGLAASTLVRNAESADLLKIFGGDGGDTISAATLRAGLISLMIDGQNGADAITGSKGDDTLFGGSFDNAGDTLAGGKGQDVIFGGGGDDIIVWRAGDGNDTVEGEAGADLLQVTGSGTDTFAIAANGSRALVLRNEDSAAIDTAGVERLSLTLGNARDYVTIGDLTGTSLRQIDIEMGLAPGTAAGDAKTDGITINGTASRDVMTLASGPDGLSVTGLTAAVTLHNAETRDSLQVLGGAGDDIIDAQSVAKSAARLTLNGGLGADVIGGSVNADTIIGASGDDIVFMGDGNDLFVWNPGDSNDVIHGGNGVDRLLINGSNVSENITLNNVNGALQFFRDVASVGLSVSGVERVEYHALGGSDSITVGDLSGTGVTRVTIDLASSAPGVSDGVPDLVSMSGRGGNDTVTISGNTAAITVAGLGPAIIINTSEATDSLRIAALGGDDVISASGLAAGSAVVYIDGGDGNDELSTGFGNDWMNGGLGRDIFLFDTALSSASNTDTIADFNTADDTIALSIQIFAAAGALGTLASDAFAIGSAAADAGDRIIYDSLNGILSYDSDGTGAAAAVTFAYVNAGMLLTAQNFLIV